MHLHAHFWFAGATDYADMHGCPHLVYPPQVGRLILRMAAAGEAAPSTLPPRPAASSFPSTLAAGGSTMMAAAAAALQADLDGLEEVGCGAWKWSAARVAGAG